jgi:hypothetical protein
MRGHAESGEVGAVVDAVEARIAGIESVGDAVRRLERTRPGRKIAQQQGIELDQD